MPKTAKEPADYILPLYMNGLSGRMLKMPAAKKVNREILLIYGHHASLERWWGLVENLSDYGNVTMPDLPGFGGMESFYKIDTRPTIDAFADYLASFIKLRYKQKHLTIVGVSYGFVVITRMLQRYPEIAVRTDLLISMVGFMHKDDIAVKPKKQKAYRLFARFLAARPIALFIRYCCLNKFVLENLYVRLPNSKQRMIEVTPIEFNKIMDFDLELWRANDVRTHWLTTSEFLDLDNCRQFIALPIVHVVSEHDHYLNNISVEQHMRQIFSDYKQFTARTKAHVPHVLADKKGMAVLLPAGLRRLLKKKA